MWIVGQDDNYVNCDNIYEIAIRRCPDGWEIYADSVYENRAKLGICKDHDSAKKAIDEFFESLKRDDLTFSMPPKSRSFQWEPISEAKKNGW